MIGVKAFHVVTTHHHDHHITTSSELQHRIIELERKRQLTPPPPPDDEQAYFSACSKEARNSNKRPTELARFALAVSHFPSPLLLFFLVVSITSTTLFRLTKTQSLPLSHHPIPTPLAPHS